MLKASERESKGGKGEKNIWKGIIDWESRKREGIR